MSSSTKPNAAARVRPRRRLTLQPLIHVAALIPMALLVYDVVAGRLSVNPIQDITQRTGRTALILLVLSLACTPANILTGWSGVLRWRRPLGLYAFVYALTHFFIFVGVDYGFNFRFIWMDVGMKRYVFVGLAAFLILVPLAITSTDGAKKRLRKRWRKLHRWVYLAGILVTVHYTWVVKSDIRQPLLWGALVLLLLAIRLPPIRRALLRLRARRDAAKPSATTPVPE